jgi:hypothetical protein
MTGMKYFIDTHDQATGHFPAGLTPEQFEQFFQKYEAACREEGVILLRVDVGYQEGRAFCATMASSAEAVRRAHERVGLPFDAITEVRSAVSNNAFLPREK